MHRLLSIVISASIALSPDCAWSGPGQNGFKPPRAADGHVDLEGTWDSINLTPLERPAQFTSLVMSPEDAQKARDIWINARNDMSVPADPTNANNLLIERIRGDFHTSVIIDPPDGRIPGTAAFYLKVKSNRVNVMSAFDHPEQRPGGERCLTSSASNAPMLTLPANNFHQVIQTPNAIVIASESLHEARVVRLNAKHPPAHVTALLGDSIGWWEGDTLVVETSNYRNDTVIGSATFTVLLSNSATVTERFTLLGRDELGYVFTVNDPANYTRPWTGESVFRRSNEKMFEYACHEGNYALTFILQAARARDAEAKQKE